jgi:hypothetical protein
LPAAQRLSTIAASSLPCFTREPAADQSTFAWVQRVRDAGPPIVVR